MNQTLRPQDKERLTNREWRLSHFYRIRNKQGKLIIFKKNRAQEHFDKHKHTRNIIIKSRQLGFCLDPETKILTTDLRWIKLKDVSSGIEIVAVEEFPTNGRGGGRKMVSAIIEKSIKVFRKAYKIILDDGRELICTAKHPWLARKSASDCRWMTIEGKNHYGTRSKDKLTIGTYIRWITKTWDEANTEDGWFGGMLDGEGSIANKNKAASINVSQRKGDVWERMINYCKNRNYDFTIENDDKKPIRPSKFGKVPVPKVVIGKMAEMFRLIGQTRPTRFIKNKFWENRELPKGKRGGKLNHWSKIVKIEELEEQEMIDLQTSAKTYIAEGFVSHNTTFETIDMLDESLFRRNFQGLFIAQDLDTAKDIFSNKVELAWNNFVLKDLYKLNTESARQMKFDFGDGTISSLTVDSSGRSGTFDRLHISEFATVCKKFPDKAKEILNGSIPAVPLKGRVDIETTIVESEGITYDLFWNAWEKGEPKTPTEFKAHFYNWQWDDEELALITKQNIAGFKAIEDYKLFIDYQKKYKLSDKEITYYYFKWLSLNRSWEAMKKEYPTTVYEAFEGSGNKLFDLNKISLMIIRQGNKAGDWTFYDEPLLGHTYVLGADVAEGVGQDSSTCVIWDVTLLKPCVVAEYKNNIIAPDLFAYEIKNGASRYNMSLCGVERNNHGHTTLLKLREIYPEEYIYKDDKERWGWQTNLVSKPKMLFDLLTAVNNELVDIPSIHIQNEMRRYDKEDVSKVRFDEEFTQHWDLLIAAAIGFQMKNFLFTNTSGLSIYIPEDV